MDLHDFVGWNPTAGGSEELLGFIIMLAAAPFVIKWALTGVCGVVRGLWRAFERFNGVPEDELC